MQTLVTLMSIMIAFLFSETISIDKFKKNFIICMVIISYVSLISFLIYTVNPSLFTIFPRFTNSQGRSSYFLVFSMVTNFIARNQGIFWEPGAFQFFLCLAYIFELSNDRVQPRKWILILFLITFASTISTTGIIVALLLVTYTMSRHRGKSNIIKAMVIISLLLSIFFSVLPYLDGQWEYALVGKIQELFDYRPGIGSSSANIRMDSLYYPLNELTNSPIWGIGRSGYEKLAQYTGHSIFTFTPLNLVAIHGPIYGSIIIIGIYNFIKMNFKMTFDSMIIFLIFMLSISTEALQNDVFILTMSFMGWKYYSKKLKFTKPSNLESINY